MASRGGPRAVGSDGSDFTHREQVALRYQESTALKYKLKVLAYVNLALCLPHVAFVLNSHLNLVRVPGMNHGACHYVLLTTAVASLFYLVALPRNRTLLIQLGSLTMLLCGIGGAVFGLFQYYNLVTLLLIDEFEGIVKKAFSIMAVMLYTVFLTDLLVYGMMLHVARQLVASWDARKKK